jgi:hypothetical protein
MTSSTKKKKSQNPLLWVVEPIMEEPSFIERAWFGCRAVYLHGRLMLVLCSGEEPWNGLLIATEREFHDAILQEFGNVVRHPVLKKWLYLPENSEDFETVSSEIVEAVRTGDQRLGVEPGERKRKRKKASEQFK